MSRRLKTITRVISFVLSLILIYQASPVEAIAANITDLTTTQSNDFSENEFNDIVNIYYGSHSIDVGRAGTLSIDDHSLIPTLSFSSLSIDGNISPVSISMQYNGAEYRFLDEVVNFTPAFFANGWMTNYNRFVIELNYSDTTRIAYTTGDGYILSFDSTDLTEDEQTSLPAGTTKWITEASDGYILYKYGSENEYSYIINTEYEKLCFDADGRLVSIINTVNNASVEIDYSQTITDAIEKITDGTGREYRFTYTDGLLTKIKCFGSDSAPIIAGDGEYAAPLEMNFAYTQGKLTQVTFPDGKNTYYTYNSSGMLASAVNIDGYRAEITCTDGIVSRLAEYSPNSTAGGFVNITVNGNTRTFTDDKGEIQTKTFDEQGNIITIVDGEGNYLYGQPEENEEETTPEEESSEIFEEETSEPYYESTCPCDNCPEWDCECVCESEEVCECMQCKRYTDTQQNENGNITADNSFDGEKTMTSLTSYTSDGNYIESSVDTSGNQVYYIYGQDGYLDSMTSGESTVDFRYDSMGNLVELSQQVSGLANGTTMSNSYTYTNDRVTSITHNGFSYHFDYDEWGNQTGVKVSDHTLVTYEYDHSEADRLTKINYANGQSESYTYDDNGNITAVSHDNGATNTYEYEYNSDGVLTKVTDNRCGLVTTYTDTSTQIRTADNTLVYSTVTNEDGTQTENLFDHVLTYTYDSEYNQFTGTTTSTKTFNDSVLVNDDTVYTIDSTYDLSVTTDWFGRTQSKSVNVDSLQTNADTQETTESNFSGEYSFTYDDTATTASTKITSHSSSFTSANYTYDRTDYYEYDASGNITTISRYVDIDGQEILVPFYHYEYDEAGQLIREDILEQEKTIIYTYDTGGNIVSKKEYDFALDGDDNSLSFTEITDDMTPNGVHSYYYAEELWMDLLSNYTYTKNGKTKTNTYFDCDLAGNITYFNGNEYTWTAGRQLATSTAGEDFFRYTYNENGFLHEIEICEDENSPTLEKFVYIWDGDKLIARQLVSYDPQDNGLIVTSRIIYDSEDEPQGFIAESQQHGEYKGSMTFLYRKNLQGDVTGLIEAVTGELVASYTYDAYGNPSAHPVNDKPLSVLSSWIYMAYTPQLYRGYAYAMVGDGICYYLGSRFYMPQLGRFLNADKHTDTDTGVIGTNMYAYCNNNPVIFIDPTGEMSKLLTLLQTVVSFIQKLSTISTANNGNGTKLKPKILSNSIPITVNSKSYWFKCTIEGATDINITTSTTSEIVIYKKNGVLKKEIDHYKGSSYSSTLKYPYENTYFIHVKASKNVKISCTVKQHVDFHTSTKGAMWIRSNEPKYIETDLKCSKIWYLNASKVNDLITYLNDDDYVSNSAAISSGAKTVLEVAQRFATNANLVYWVDLIADICDFEFLPTYKSIIINDVRTQAGAVHNSITNTYTYKNGVILYEIDSYPTKTYRIEKWGGYYMYGDGGCCGTWHIT